MPLFDPIPFTSRPTFRYEISSAWLYGIMMGIVGLAAVFARMKLDASPIEVALITAAPSAGMLFTVFWGYYASTRRKMPLIFWPGVIGRSLIIVIAFVSDSLWFTAIILLSYLISLLITPVQAGVHQANYPEEFRGRIIGRVRGVLYLTSAVVALIAGRILDHNVDDFRYLFPVAGIAGCASILLFSRIRIRRERWTIARRPPPFSIRKSLGVLLSNKRFGAFELFFGLHGFASHMMRPVVVLFLTDVIKVDYTQSAAALELIPKLCMVSAVLLCGSIVDRHNPMTARGFFNLLACVVPVVYFFSHTVTPIYIAKGIEGIALGGSGIIWVIGALYFANEKTAPTYQGVHTTLTGVRGILGPFMGIFLLRFVGIRSVFLLAFCMQLIASVAMFKMGRMERQKNAVQTEPGNDS